MSNETTTTDIATMDDALDASAVIQAFQSNTGSVYSTFTGNDFDTRLAVIDAMTNSAPLSENLNTVINLTNFVAQAIQIRDESKGMVDVVRIVLIDDQGKSYHAISTGVVRALQNIVGVLGQPATWPGAVPVVAIDEKGRSGFRYTTLNVAKPKK